jgi:hypothetical protein
MKKLRNNEMSNEIEDKDTEDFSSLWSNMPSYIQEDPVIEDYFLAAHLMTMAIWRMHSEKEEYE